MQRCACNSGSVNLHRVENSCHTDATGSRRREVDIAEYCLHGLILPLQGDLVTLMVAGSAQALSEGDIVVLDDQAVNRVIDLIRLEHRNGFHNGLDVTDHMTGAVEALFLHEVPFLLFCHDRRVYQLESFHFQVTLCRFLGIQQACGSTGVRTAELVRLFQCLIDAVEGCIGDGSLAPDDHLTEVRDFLGDVFEAGLHIGGDILAYRPVAASGGLHKLAVLVGQDNGESVFFP